jgi:hypothetical protein
MATARRKIIRSQYRILSDGERELGQKPLSRAASKSVNGDVQQLVPGR